MKTLVIISCGKKKADRQLQAKNLYTGNLFQRQLAWAQRFGDRIQILSAKHGIIDLDKQLEPYDVTMTDLSKDQRESLSTQVYFWYRNIHGDYDRIIVLGSKLYVGVIRDALEMADTSEIMLDPLQGLQIGQRISWLSQMEDPYFDHCDDDEEFEDDDDMVRREYGEFLGDQAVSDILEILRDIRFQSDQAALRKIRDEDSEAHRLICRRKAPAKLLAYEKELQEAEFEKRRPGARKQINKIIRRERHRLGGVA